jgi:DNA invertase Pin-like site-specific DNA recombinase
MKRAALYARVSTSNHGQDPEVQLRELRNYCLQHDWQIVHEYIDVSCGAVSQRPELNALMKGAEDKLFDTVLVWKFDRFARSTIHLAQALSDFKSCGISFVSMTEQIDTSTPSGKLVFTILGACAEMEREIIAERVKAGLRNAAANGRHGGRPRSCISPETVRLSVVNHGSVRKAAWSLNISYGLAYELYRKGRKE